MRAPPPFYGRGHPPARLHGRSVAQEGVGQLRVGGAARVTVADGRMALLRPLPQPQLLGDQLRVGRVRALERAGERRDLRLDLGHGGVERLAPRGGLGARLGREDAPPLRPPLVLRHHRLQLGAGLGQRGRCRHIGLIKVRSLAEACRP